MAQVKCDYCGKIYDDFISNIKRRKKHYCSSECYHKSRCKKLRVVEENEFLSEYNRYFSIVRRLINNYDKYYHDELTQIARITIYEILGKNPKERIQLINKYSYYRIALMRTFKNYFRLENKQKCLFIEDLDNDFIDYTYTPADSIDNKALLFKICREIKNNKNLGNEILYQRVFCDKSISYLTKKYNISKNKLWQIFMLQKKD